MTIDPYLLTIAIVALLLGFLIGFGIRAPLKRKSAVLQERNDGLTRERDAAPGTTSKHERRRPEQRRCPRDQILPWSRIAMTSP